MCMYSIGVSKRTKKAMDKQDRKFRDRQALAKREITYMDDSLPVKWDDWANGFFDKIMFYEKTEDKRYKGFCECGACVALSQARSGRKIQCISCKETVVLKDWKRKTSFKQRNYFAFLDPKADAWIRRLFVGYKVSSFDGTNTTYKLYMQEEERCYLYPDGDNYLFHVAFGGEMGKWYVGPGRVHGMGYYSWRGSNQALHTYPYNLGRIFQNTIFQYSALEIATRVSFVDPVRYLLREKKEPKLETLYKLGLYKLAEQVYNPAWYGDKILDELRDTDALKKIGIDRMEEVEECRYLSFDQLIARKEIKRWKINSSDRMDAIEFIQCLNAKSGTDFQYSFLSRQGMFNYWKTQRNQCTRYSAVRNFLNDYADYISDAHSLGFNLKDTKISKPRDFKKMHDWAMNEIKMQETQVYDAQILAVYNSIHKLCEWSDKNYKVIMPSTSREIVEEGIRQDHCVGRYCERVAKGESVILFVRRADKPEESWYTIEIKRDMNRLNIVQCRGYKNEDKNAEEAAEIEKVKAKYTQWFNRRPANGYESEIMATYYKAVRKKGGRYISNFDNKTEYVVGTEIFAKTEKNPDKTTVKGLHIASLEFAQRFGDSWKDVAILEVQVNIHDVIVPDALDQVRTSKLKVVREVPLSELSEWGQRHLSN